MGSLETHEIIDACATVYDADCWEAYLRAFADHNPAYLCMSAPRLAETAGVDPREVRHLATDAPHAAVDLLTDAGGLGVDWGLHVARLGEDGVARQVVMGGQARLRDSSETINDRVAEAARSFPERLVAWAGLSLRDGMDAVGELRRCVMDLGMRGAAITHFLDGVDPLGAQSDALYAEASRLGVPLWIHTGHNLSPGHRVDHCAWAQIDEIARRHPALTVVAGHGGWPWVLEMVALCQRHPGLYLETSSHRPGHMARPGSGWESLLRFGSDIVAGRVLFGSMGWIHGMSERALADELEELSLPDRTLRAWRHDNAARLLDRVG